jgi:tRNA nucleotidyltransferase (CCA-adding enzyme)
MTPGSAPLDRRVGRPNIRDMFVTPPEVLTIARRLQGAGYECVVVGGGVRDQLRGYPAKDWDLATDATPAQVSAVLPGVRATTRFGTALVPGGPGGAIVEVTTYRTEGGYSDFRRPDVVRFTGSLTADLARRDFTMNAIAYDPVSGVILDPYGGAADLRARRIRAVGTPAERFGEDALRLLRAIRFLATLDFSLEPATAAAISACAPLARHLAAERSGIELARTLAGSAAPRALETAARLGLLGVVLPELAPVTAGLHAAAALAQVSPTPATRAAAVCWALLLHHVDSPAATRARLLGLGLGDELAATSALIVGAASLADANFPNEAALLRALRPFSPAVFEAGLQVAEACARAANRPAALLTSAALARRARALYAAHRPRSVAELAIGGEDLLGLGLHPGPLFGRLLSAALEAVTDGLVPNERGALLAFIRTQTKA